MSDSQSIDISLVCRKAIQEIRRNSVQRKPRSNAANLDIWRRRLNYVRDEAKSDGIWQEATRLLAKLKLAQEGLLVAEESEIGEEIESLLQDSFERSKISKDRFSQGDELADACVSAEQHLSIARELISQFDLVCSSDREIANRLNKGSSSDVEKLVKEISTRIEKVTSVVKEELNKFEGSK
ncbi:MAG: hypothetical protein ACUVTL_00700 [Thermoproteota archaeon]